jgi:hypothetical protein
MTAIETMWANGHPRIETLIERPWRSEIFPGDGEAECDAARVSFGHSAEPNRGFSEQARWPL